MGSHGEHLRAAEPRARRGPAAAARFGDTMPGPASRWQWPPSSPGEPRRAAVPSRPRRREVGAPGAAGARPGSPGRLPGRMRAGPGRAGPAAFCRRPRPPRPPWRGSARSRARAALPPRAALPGGGLPAARLLTGVLFFSSRQNRCYGDSSAGTVRWERPLSRRL